MSLHSLLAISLIALASAQTPEPLASKHFAYPSQIPYQVSPAGPSAGPRGGQTGYNICNSTTEGTSSMCQTMFVNSIADFCLWSSPKKDDTIGASEAYEVAWCTKPGHGTQLIPDGAISGLQLLYAKDYIQIVGFINQAMINLDPTDEGGELDPHGADEAGNPIGGLVYSNGFSSNSGSFSSQLSSNTSSSNFTQVIEWVNFNGGNFFCLKVCNPAGSNAPELCQHIYDEIGCSYNAPNAAQNGTYEVCDSDNMTPPGVFTTAPGQTTTWFQPTVGPVGTPPYTVVVPSSSNCKTYASSELFAVASATATATGSAGSGSNSNGAGASGSRSGSGASPSATAGSSGAMALGAPLAMFAAAVFGAVFTVMA